MMMREESRREGALASLSDANGRISVSRRELSTCASSNGPTLTSQPYVRCAYALLPRADYVALDVRIAALHWQHIGLSYSGAATKHIAYSRQQPFQTRKVFEFQTHIQTLPPKQTIFPEFSDVELNRLPSSYSAASKMETEMAQEATGGDFHHHPLNHSTQSIRLVEILPKHLSSSSLVQCVMRPATINAKYVCLSYRWGAPSPCQQILINNKPFMVRQNLFDFLSMTYENQ